MQTTKKYKKLSRDIIFIVIFAFILSILIINILQYMYYNNKMRHQIIDESKGLMNLIDANFKNTESQIVQLFATIISNRELCKLINIDSTDALEILHTQLRAEEQLKILVANYDFINAVVIVRDDGLIYSNIRKFNSYYSDTLTEKWFVQLQDNNDQYYSMIHKVYMENSGYCDMVSYRSNFFELRNPNTHHFKLILHIPISNMQNYLSTIKSHYGNVVLRNRWNNIIYSDISDENDYTNMVNNSMESDLYETSQYLILNMMLMDDEWNLSFVISKKILYKNDLKYLFLILFISIIVFIFVSIFVAIYINRKLRPLTLLKNCMLSLPYSRVIPNIPYNTADEVGCIWSAFIEMNHELNSSIKKMIEAEMNRRNISSDLLLSRINLHFIYNTLNTFIFLVSAKRNEDAITMTRAFISLLQDVVQVGQDKIVVTLHEEITTIQQYMIIQKYKYPYPIKVLYEIDDELLDCLIPKMSLEPIVENSVFHGFTQTNHPGEILIKVEHIDKYLWVSVLDNGVGMSAKVIEDILNGKEVASEMKAYTRGIGITNIRDRLKLIYGDQSDFQLNSIENEGTTVKFCVPYSKSKKDL